jgi:hypothetical protein
MPSLTLFQQSEVVRKKMFPIWREQKFNVLLDFINKGEVQKIGERDFRIPYEISLGGDAGTYDPLGGDMGRGSQPQGGVMIQSYFPMRLNFEFDKLSIKATSNPGVAIENPFLKCIAKGFEEFRLYRDKWYHGYGTAQLASAVAHSSASGVSVYTLDGVFGAQRLRRFQKVSVYDSTLTTLKTNALRISQVNSGLGGAPPSITLNGVVPGAASNDVFCFDGASGPSPAGPRGLGYWISPATSGITAGVDRSAESQIIAKSINANGSPYSVEHVMALYDQIFNDRTQVANEIIAICAPSQRAAAYNNLLTVQNILLDSTQAQAVDRLPSLKGKNVFMWGNVPHYVDPHADKTSVYFFVPSLWGRAVLSEEDFFQRDGVSGEAGRFFAIYGASGGPAAATWFGLTCDENPYTIDAGAQGVIYGLPLPAYHS